MSETVTSTQATQAATATVASAVTGAIDPTTLIGPILSGAATLIQYLASLPGQQRQAAIDALSAAEKAAEAAEGDFQTKSQAALAAMDAHIAAADSAEHAQAVQAVVDSAKAWAANVAGAFKTPVPLVQVSPTP